MTGRHPALVDPRVTASLPWCTVSLRAWVQACRPLAQANIAVPLLLGEMLALGHGHAELDVGLLVVAHAFGVLDQLFIVWANDVADEAADRVNEAPTPFSGGSRVLPEGKLRPRQLARAAIGAALAMLGLSLYAAVALERPSMPLWWALSVVLLWAYSFPPARLSYRGAGAITQAFGVMVVLPLLGFYLQAGDLRAFPWLALLPCVALGLAGNITTALPDHAADETAGKRTWPVRYGLPRARKHGLQLIALGALGAPLVLPDLPQAGLAAIEAVPLVLLLINARTLRRPGEPSRRQTLWFVILNGAAINAALLGWIVALALRPPWGFGG